MALTHGFGNGRLQEILGLHQEQHSKVVNQRAGTSLGDLVSKWVCGSRSGDKGLQVLHAQRHTQPVPLQVGVQRCPALLTDGLSTSNVCDATSSQRPSSPATPVLHRAALWCVFAVPNALRRSRSPRSGPRSLAAAGRSRREPPSSQRKSRNWVSYTESCQASKRVSGTTVQHPA